MESVGEFSITNPKFFKALREETLSMDSETLPKTITVSTASPSASVTPRTSDESSSPGPVTVRGLINIMETNFILRATFADPEEAEGVLRMLVNHDAAGACDAMKQSGNVELQPLTKFALSPIAEDTILP